MRARPIIVALAYTWLTCVAVLNLAVAVYAFREQGFAGVQYIYSPFTVSTHIINAFLVLPAFGLFWLRDRL